MGREVVVGYCWPQSVCPGEQVGVHMSSSAGRPVRVEVARIGGRREVVFSSDAVTADEHETPRDAASKGCDWPVALALDIDSTWRSGYYEVAMEIDVGEKVIAGGRALKLMSDHSSFGEEARPPSVS